MDKEIVNLYSLPNYIDERGRIQMILESCSIGSISRIISEPNTTRANHKHFLDNHWIEVIEGQIELYERTYDCDKPTKRVLNVNDMAFTPYEVSHTMFFPVFTIFNCYSKLSRKQRDYEADTIKFDYSLKDVYDNWKD